MAQPFLPTIDGWYRDEELGRAFRVVALDAESESIEVQFYNGDIGEYDFNGWRESAFLPIAAPEDAGAPFDDLEPDDFGYTDTDLHGPGDLSLDDLLDDMESFG